MLELHGVTKRFGNRATAVAGGERRYVIDGGNGLPKP